MLLMLLGLPWQSGSNTTEAVIALSWNWGQHDVKWLELKSSETDPERYFLTSEAWYVEEWSGEEWDATVTRLDNGQWLAEIQPVDFSRVYGEAYEEIFPTREAAQRWAETEMKLDRRI